MSMEPQYREQILSGEGDWMGTMPSQYFVQMGLAGASFKHIIDAGNGWWLTLFQAADDHSGLFSVAVTDHHGILWPWPLEEPSAPDGGNYVVRGDVVNVHDWLITLSKTLSAGCTNHDVCVFAGWCERCKYAAEVVLWGGHYCAYCACDRQDEHDEYRPSGVYRFRTHMLKPFEWRSDGQGRVFPVSEGQSG